MWYVGEIVPDLGVDFMIGVRFMELVGSIIDHGTAKIYARNADIKVIPSETYIPLHVSTIA